MPITGIHAVLHSSQPEALRQTLQDAFGWSSVDSGGGWLIFALPPAELAVHPTAQPAHWLSLMCDDLNATIAQLRDKGLTILGEPHEERWGMVTTILLPGDVEMLLYEPRHATMVPTGSPQGGQMVQDAEK